MPRIRPLLIAAVVAGTALGVGGSVSYYEESLPSTLNPLFATTMVDRRTHELLFDRLFYRSAVTAEIKSRLVESAEVTDRGQRVVLTLKEGITWHDGKPLQPADVCFTVDAMLDAGTPSHLSRAYTEVIASCTASRRDVTITFTRPYYNPTERLGFPVLPAHQFGGDTSIQPDHVFASRPVGTGPLSGTKGRREVTFSAHRNAHHNPRISEVRLGEGRDPQVAIRTLMNGGVQGVVSVAPPHRGEIAATDNIALKSYDLRSWWFIAVNTHRAPLNDVRVRRALDAILDREELRRLTMGYDPQDVQQPCQFISGPFVPSSPYYNRAVKVNSRADITRARREMDAAGATYQNGAWLMKGEPVVLKIGMNAPLDLEAKDLLNQIGNQLQAGGFGRQVHKISSDDWIRRAVTGHLDDFDLLIGKWSFGVVEDVAPLFEARRGGKGTLNIFNYDDPVVNQMVRRFDSAGTDTQAQDAYHELHAYLADALPYLFLWKLDTKSGWSLDVRGNTIAPYYYFTEFDGWESVSR